MGLIKHWIISLCGATALAGLFQVFLSNSNLKKVINVFLSIFVLFYTVIPLTDIEFSEYQIEFENVNIDEFSEESYEQIIVSSISELCHKNSVEVLAIDVESTLEDGELIVSEIIVEIDDYNKSNQLEKVIYDELGFEVSVIG